MTKKAKKDVVYIVWKYDAKNGGHVIEQYKMTIPDFIERAGRRDEHIKRFAENVAQDLRDEGNTIVSIEVYAKAQELSTMRWW